MKLRRAGLMALFVDRRRVSSGVEQTRFAYLIFWEADEFVSGVDKGARRKWAPLSTEFAARNRADTQPALGKGVGDMSICFCTGAVFEDVAGNPDDRRICLRCQTSSRVFRGGEGGYTGKGRCPTRAERATSLGIWQG